MSVPGLALDWAWRWSSSSEPKCGKVYVNLVLPARPACPSLDNAHTQDGLHLELLDLRAHVWGVEQDLQKVVKSGEL